MGIGTRIPSMGVLAGLALGAALACGGDRWEGHPSGPYDVANAVLVLDLDKDGRADALTAMATWGGGPPHPGFVSRRIQDPTHPGSFRDPVRQDAGSDPIALAAGDLDGDGLPDLVVANTQMLPDPIRENSLSLLMTGPNVLTVLPPKPLPLGPRDPVDLALGDFDGDGRLDIAVAARGGKDLLVFFQSAPGNFGSPLHVPLGAEPCAVLAADLNGDGATDLAVGTTAGHVALLLQDPQGMGPSRFRAPVEIPVAGRPIQIRAADLDGDGKVDLALVLAWDEGLALLYQDPAHPGTFRPPFFLDTGDHFPRALAIADLDGDGRPEIVVANEGAPGWPGSITILIRASGGPGFVIQSLYPGLRGPCSIAIGDLNGDGRPDLLIADGDPVVRFQDPGHPGTFLGPTTLRH